MTRKELKSIRLEGENERLKKHNIELTHALRGLLETIGYYARQPAHVPFAEVAFKEMSDTMDCAKRALAGGK